MTEDSSEKSHNVSCDECGHMISDEFIKKNQNKPLYCELCGAQINLKSSEKEEISKRERKEEIITPPEENEVRFSYTIEELRQETRNYIYQKIYELLKTDIFVIGRLKQQKDLKHSQKIKLAKKLRRILLHTSLPTQGLEQLTKISRKKIENYFDTFKSSLKAKQRFRSKIHPGIIKNIEFIFRLINGDFELSTLSKDNQNAIKNLLHTQGFKIKIKTRNSFSYQLSLFLCRQIYKKITVQDNTLEFPPNKNLLTEHFILKTAKDMITLILKELVKERFSRHYRTLKRKLELDWVYRESLINHICSLVKVTHKLIYTKGNESKLNGFEKLIAEDLKKSKFFENDEYLTPEFKLNLTLIICRIIYKIMESNTNLNSQEQKSKNLNILNKNEISNLILEEILARNKIKPEFLKKIYKISLEEFQKEYVKFQAKIENDILYKENFRIYLFQLVMIVKKITQRESKKSKHTKIELAVITDLSNYNFIWDNDQISAHDCFIKNEINSFDLDKNNQNINKENSKISIISNLDPMIKYRTIISLTYVLLDYKYKHIGFKNEFEKEIICSASTQEVLNDISKEYYRKGEPLIAFIPNGKILPLEEIHYKWLEQENYGKNFVIFISPQRYINKLTSVFDPLSEERLKIELDRFLNKLTIILDGISFKEEGQLEDKTLNTKRKEKKIEICNNKVIIEEKKSNGSWVKKNLYQDEALSILFGMNKGFIKTTKDRIHQGLQVGITEDSLFKIYSELCRKIYNSGKNFEVLVQGIKNALDSYIKTIYNTQYRDNPLYFTLLEFSANLRDIIYRADLISSSTYEGLSELDLDSRMLNNLRSIISKHRGLKNEEVVTNLWVELYSELINKYGETLRAKGLIGLFNFGFESLFNKVQEKLIPSYAENTIRGEFIKEILKIFPNNMFVSSGSLSKILFNDNLYLNRKFLIEERIHLLIGSEIYERIEDNILDLKLNDFSFFTKLLSNEQLSIIQENIIKVIGFFKRFYANDRSSILEDFAKRILEKILNSLNMFENIKVESKWPNWLKSSKGRPLELDGYVEELNFAFEMNGPYHDDPKIVAKLLDMPLKDANKKVKDIRLNDRIKVTECLQNGIDLLVLNYRMDYEEIVNICCKYIADMINHRFPNKNIKWNDFQIDWKNILSDVKRLRMEKIMFRFNNRGIVENLEDLK